MEQPVLQVVDVFLYDDQRPVYLMQAHGFDQRKVGGQFPCFQFRGRPKYAAYDQLPHYLVKVECELAVTFHARADPVDSEVIIDLVENQVADVERPVGVLVYYPVGVVPDTDSTLVQSIV